MNPRRVHRGSGAPLAKTAKMKTTAAIVFGTLVVALHGTCQGADVFYLTNAVAHTNYGPFEYLHGGKVTIGDQTLEIRRLLTDDERIKYRLQKVIVPEIQFRGAPLSNVVAFFQSAAAECERNTEDKTNTIRFVIEGQADQNVPGTADTDIDSGMMRYVSLYTAVREVCRQADLDFKIQNGAVVLMKRKPQEGQQPAGERRDKPAPQPQR